MAGTSEGGARDGDGCAMPCTVRRLWCGWLVCLTFPPFTVGVGCGPAGPFTVRRLWCGSVVCAINPPFTVGVGCGPEWPCTVRRLWYGSQERGPLDACARATQCDDNPEEKGEGKHAPTCELCGAKEGPQEKEVAKAHSKSQK